MAPSDHRAKRQYNASQSTITSYFSRASSTQQLDPISTAFPSQPGQVQCDLLTVGMRVRKAVSEGYKTGTYSALSIFHDTTAPTPAEADAPNQVQNTSTSRPVFGSNIRELAPFCGLNKVGGFSQQFTEPTESFPLMSSQESNVSLESTGAGKRRFQDDDEIEGGGETATFLQGDFESWQLEEAISPKSKPAGLAFRMGGRPMVMPKTRKKKVDGTEKYTDDWEQENINDFGEAEFLDYGHLNGEDVDMNDV